MSKRERFGKTVFLVRETPRDGEPWRTVCDTPTEAMALRDEGEVLVGEYELKRTLKVVRNFTVTVARR